ncbi:DUF402 domain-containing protein [Nocardioides piscis]|uniref:DUF402 domain-containing protein n=1 Tax=Nocardioides piscis TaxID=2714938 RepID=A0A6G7YBP1_9ACTN|nr:DUF402 domain-containing protein [Nocardioides piscis]QIK74324.1 DUF402 domain-containing protein [Nocardioides piscis]
MPHPPGTLVRCELTKWGGSPHWSYAAVLLGDDQHGTWLGFPAGTRFERPGRSFVGRHDHVGLVPAPVAGRAPWHLATFHTAGSPWPSLGGSAAEIYIDVTTPAEWDGTVLRAVDLDLDVVRGFNGTVIVDDEDEFLEHQAAYDYPPEVVAAARASADALVALVGGRAAPYDGAHGVWLDRLHSLR